VGAAVVSCRDASPVLEPAEHDLHGVALAVMPCVISERRLAVPFWRDTWLDPAFGQSCSEPTAIVSSIGDEDFCGWQCRQDEAGALVIVHLPFGQEQDQRLAILIGDGVKLGVQAALCAPDAAGNRPFFKRLAAVRCALRWVASIIMR
jgi:hypothetical protein